MQYNEKENTALILAKIRSVLGCHNNLMFKLNVIGSRNCKLTCINVMNRNNTMWILRGELRYVYAWHTDKCERAKIMIGQKIFSNINFW